MSKDMLKLFVDMDSCEVVKENLISVATIDNVYKGLIEAVQCIKELKADRDKIKAEHNDALNTFRERVISALGWPPRWSPDSEHTDDKIISAISTRTSAWDSCFNNTVDLIEQKNAFKKDVAKVLGYVDSYEMPMSQEFLLMRIRSLVNGRIIARNDLITCRSNNTELKTNIDAAYKKRDLYKKLYKDLVDHVVDAVGWSGKGAALDATLIKELDKLAKTRNDLIAFRSSVVEALDWAPLTYHDQQDPRVVTEHILDTIRRRTIAYKCYYDFRAKIIAALGIFSNEARSDEQMVAVIKNCVGSQVTKEVSTTFRSKLVEVLGYHNGATSEDDDYLIEAIRKEVTELRSFRTHVSRLFYHLESDDAGLLVHIQNLREMERSWEKWLKTRASSGE